MKSTHPLHLNLRKVVSCLSDVLAPAEIQKINEELYRNVRQGLLLSEDHLRFALAAGTEGAIGWRHAVSRGYYCCYCASRSIRLGKTGVFSTEVDDHKKIGDLPDDFPDRAKWADILTKFRADRNLADYDHTAGTGELEYSADQYLKYAEDFVKNVKAYLHKEGFI